MNKLQPAFAMVEDDAQRAQESRGLLGPSPLFEQPVFYHLVDAEIMQLQIVPQGFFEGRQRSQPYEFASCNSHTVTSSLKPDHL